MYLAFLNPLQLGISPDRVLSVSSTIPRTNQKYLMNFWVELLRSPPLVHTSNISLRTANPQATPKARKSCTFPSTSYLRRPIILNCAHVRSAGLAGAFVDREVETKGVGSEDSVAITLLIHVLVVRLHRQREGEALWSVLPFHSFAALTICADQFYSPGKYKPSIQQQLWYRFQQRLQQRLQQQLLDVDANRNCTRGFVNEVTESSLYQNTTRTYIQSTTLFRTCERTSEKTKKRVRSHFDHNKDAHRRYGHTPWFPKRSRLRKALTINAGR